MKYLLIYLFATALLVGANLLVYKFLKHFNRKPRSMLGLVIIAILFEIAVIYLWLY